MTGTRSVDVGWGPDGLRDLAARCDVLVVVDVLRFTTAVDVAVARGARVHPYRWHDGTEEAYARELGAELAGRGVDDHPDRLWSLSPVALSTIPPGTALVLPSPNGAALSFDASAAGAACVVAGCLRNASAVARWAGEQGERIGVLAAGERWQGASGPLRPAVEDWLGAGAIVAALRRGSCTPSPDAVAAAGSFEAVRAAGLEALVAATPSARFLHERGSSADVAMAAQHDVSTCVPVLRGDCFVDAGVADDRPAPGAMGE